MDNLSQNYEVYPNQIKKPQHQEEHDIIILVNKLLMDAIKNNISDIHIEGLQHHYRIRFRRDGVLLEVKQLSKNIARRVITRLKIMSQLNIAETRMPQDGQINFNHHFSQNIRISICPTVNGEKVVLRFLDNKDINLNIASLGLTEIQINLLHEKLNQTQGLILVTGSTGSGKTITLYSALQYLNQIKNNIITIEDPVEINLDGINQINANNPIGLSFEKILPAILRQDPDVIMVGEIRNKETARIALEAAQTGHLVLSTLHANSAFEAMMRFNSIDPSLIRLMNANALIIAQRLLKKLCPHCKNKKLNSYYEATGCMQCTNGYQGRIGIFECIPYSHSLMAAIDKANFTNLIHQAKKNNWMLLNEAVHEKLKEGLVDLLEARKIIRHD